MRLVVRGVGTCLVGFASAAAAAAGAPGPGAAAPAVEAAIRSVYPALVRIHAVNLYYVDGREVKAESVGSGVVISADGHVVTNHHVAGRARRIRCTLPDREEIQAVLVGSDALSDLAVLKLDLAGRTAPLPVARFGDSDALQIGDPVLALGSPMALSQSATLGIISNTDMTFPDLMWPQSFKLDGEQTGSIVKWIGHDAQISPGNSGGPLVNLRGEIVGINEISFGLGGAIPSNLARSVAEAIIAHGEVPRSWVGLELQPLIGAERGGEGGLVSGVAAGSPAEKAGLEPGDALLSYGGAPVAVRHSEELPQVNRLILGTPLGSTVEVVYRRKGRVHKASLTTVARGAALGQEAEAAAWGLTLRELTLLSAKELKRDPGTGVVVSSVGAGTPSAEAKPPLEDDDIVTALAGRPVRSIAEFQEVTASLTAGEAAAVPVLVAFERGGQRLLTVVKLGAHRGRDRSVEATKAWLPAATQVLTTDLAAALGLAGERGVRVTEVYPDSTAQRAGLKVGDVILKLDGTPVAASRPEDLEVFPAMVRQYAVGARVTLDVVRDGARRAVAVELAASPPSVRELAEYRDAHFDFSARDLTFVDRMEAGLDVQSGVLVTRVEGGGWAALAHMAVGDVVLAVDGARVPTAAALESSMRRIAAARPGHVVFLVRRGVHTLFLELEPAWIPAAVPGREGDRG